MKRQALTYFLAPFALTLALAASPAKAVLNYNIFESMGDLVVETSGSLNLPLPNVTIQSCGSGALVSAGGIICTGPDIVGRLYFISGPTDFPGTAFLVPATSVSGIYTSISSGVILTMDPSYISGTPIISNAIFSGKTLADIGLTPASGLLGTWTLEGTGDTININVLPSVAPVPGPLPLVGVGAGFGFSRRLRQRIQRRQTQTKS